MRWTMIAASGAALVAALVTACSAHPPPAADATTTANAAVTAGSTPPGTSAACYAFAVDALRHRVVVRRKPPACAGVAQVQINQDVARAIRTVIGPHPKALSRRLAAAESRYLASLVEPVRPPASSIAVGAATTSGTLALRLSALAAWLATAAAGSYLLAGLMTRDSRRRLIRRLGSLPVVPLSHAGLAIAGLVLWIAFTVTTVAALAWADVGLTWVIAGLGMATLLGGPDQPTASAADSAAAGELDAGSTAPFPVRVPVVVIALHGALATLTILLVLLAAVGVG